jgi:Zn finger protein HypA/HybF involved in hydrogenase expression
MLIWNTKECPGCGKTVEIKIMSLVAVCPICAMFYADVENGRGWYYSRQNYLRGDAPCAD